MKNFWKQLGKSVCYFLLFFGMQLAWFLVFEVFYIFKESFVAAANGVEPDVMAITEGAMNFMLESTNLVSIISGCLTLVVLWLFFLIRKKNVLKEVQVKAVKGKDVLLIAALGIVFATTISFGLNLLPESMLAEYGDNIQMAIGDSTLIMVISNMLVAPIVEEVIFRGLIFTRMNKAVPTVWAVIISSLVFGIAHGQIVWMAYAFLLGTLCAVMFVKTGSLLASIWLHMVFNICGVVIPTLCAGITSFPVIVAIAVIGLVATVAMLTVILKNNKAEKDTLQTV